MNAAQNLTLQKIAAWQIAGVCGDRNHEIVAALPALQRGAVWKVRQIEELWDSIMRGFPIGAFLVSQFDDELGRQKFKFQQDGLPEPTHHLLDGQQRATGIALGFFDPYRQNAQLTKSVMWIDLGAPPAGRDVGFVFRTTTSAHPWGYSRTDPNNRISEGQIRSAINAFRAATPHLREKRPSEMPLVHTWPWESEAPIPFSWLIDAVTTSPNSPREALWERMAGLPLLSEASAEISSHWKIQRENIRSAFEAHTSGFHKRLDQVLSLIGDFVIRSTYSVPVLVVPARNTLSEEVSSTVVDGDQKDDIETLFVRVNSAGTPLEGEELMYSLIKSAWIEAPEYIEKLAHRLTSPARIALLSSRLMLARNQVRKDTGDAPFRLTNAPSVTEFRRLMRANKQEFFSGFKAFVQDDGLVIFERAYAFLTEGSWALPPVLASELAHRSPDVFFLFLRWLDRLTEAGARPTELDEKKRRKVIGFLTALAWFAKDKAKAVDAIWNDLQRCETDQLDNMFSRRAFKRTCQLDERGALRMIPLLAPEELEKVLAMRITGHQGCSDTISDKDSDIWGKWQWWDWLIDGKRPKLIDEVYSKSLIIPKEEGNDESVGDRVQDAWYYFMESLWGSRQILLFSQREWLVKWFPDFDPSQPEFLEDKNRPWDYDHVHPQSYLQGKNGGALWGVPRLIKDWHGSIGNLRAWPLEANRADGDASPAKKLDSVSDEEQRYRIQNGKIARVASVIDEADWEAYWLQCVPADGSRRYLAEKNYHQERKALMNAIIRRFVALYDDWYRTLRLGDLNG